MRAGRPPITMFRMFQPNAQQHTIIPPPQMEKKEEWMNGHEQAQSSMPCLATVPCLQQPQQRKAVMLPLCRASAQHSQTPPMNGAFCMPPGREAEAKTQKRIVGEVTSPSQSQLGRMFTGVKSQPHSPSHCHPLKQVC